MAGMGVEKALRQHLCGIFMIIMKYSCLNPKGFKNPYNKIPLRRKGFETYMPAKHTLF